MRVNIGLEPLRVRVNPTLILLFHDFISSMLAKHTVIRRLLPKPFEAGEDALWSVMPFRGLRGSRLPVNLSPSLVETRLGGTYTIVSEANVRLAKAAKVTARLNKIRVRRHFLDSIEPHALRSTFMNDRKPRQWRELSSDYLLSVNEENMMRRILEDLEREFGPRRVDLTSRDFSVDEASLWSPPRMPQTNGPQFYRRKLPKNVR